MSLFRETRRIGFLKHLVGGGGRNYMCFDAIDSLHLEQLFRTALTIRMLFEQGGSRTRVYSRGCLLSFRFALMMWQGHASLFQAVAIAL